MISADTYVPQQLLRPHHTPDRGCESPSPPDSAGKGAASQKRGVEVRSPASCRNKHLMYEGYYTDTAPGESRDGMERFVQIYTSLTVLELELIS